MEMRHSSIRKAHSTAPWHITSSHELLAVTVIDEIVTGTTFRGGFFFFLFMTESKSALKYHSLCSHLWSMPGNPVSAFSQLPAHSISTSAPEALR